MCFRLLGLVLCFSILALTGADAQQLRGEASYYADKFHGRPTSTGEKYNKRAFTAANKDFPVGSILRITRTDNRKSVDVRVNDCGPHRKGRIVDLSRAAAEKIGLIRDGVAEVQIKLIELGNQGFACSDKTLTTLIRESEPEEVVDVPPVAYDVDLKQLEKRSDVAQFWVQFGAYRQENNARADYNKTLVSGLQNLQIVKDKNLYRIVAGPYTDRFSAEALKYYLEKEKSLKGVIVKI